MRSATARCKRIHNIAKDRAEEFVEDDDDKSTAIEK
jgi:hypothetical protein